MFWLGMKSWCSFDLYFSDGWWGWTFFIFIFFDHFQFLFWVLFVHLISLYWLGCWFFSFCFVYFFVCSRLIFCQVQLTKVFSHPIGHLFFLLICYAKAFSVHGSHYWLLPWFSELAHVQKTFSCACCPWVFLFYSCPCPLLQFWGFGGFWSWFLCRVSDIFYMLISSFHTIIWIVCFTIKNIFFTSL